MGRNVKETQGEKIGLVLNCVFLVCDNCGKLHTVEYPWFNKRVQRGQKKFCCSLECNKVVKSKSTRLDYIKNRIINESILDSETGCWNWTGKLSKGYGFIVVNKRLDGAHRASYMCFRGSIPKELLVRHMCNNPACVNPEHLELGTNQDNANDRGNAGHHCSGERNGGSKLKWNQVKEIRSLWLLNNFSHRIPKPYNLSVLARMFNVKPPTIRNIVDGNKWKETTAQGNTELKN